MHPQILKRVIGNDGSHLRICSAILKVSSTSKPYQPVLIFSTTHRTSLDTRSKQVVGVVSSARELIRTLKGEDYPAVVPYSLSRPMFDRDLEPEERAVRGALVSGLTGEDIRLLDVFEEDVSSGAVGGFGLLRSGVFVRAGVHPRAGLCVSTWTACRFA